MTFVRKVEIAYEVGVPLDDGQLEPLPRPGGHRIEKANGVVGKVPRVDVVLDAGERVGELDCEAVGPPRDRERGNADRDDSGPTCACDI